MPTGADAAVTLATLCYGAGISLVGQMYHLPGDWPAGAMLIAIGGLVAAALTGKNGPLIDCLRGDDVMVMREVRRLDVARGPLGVSALVRAGISAGAGP